MPGPVWSSAMDKTGESCSLLKPEAGGKDECSMGQDRGCRNLYLALTWSPNSLCEWRHLAGPLFPHLKNGKGLCLILEDCPALTFFDSLRSISFPVSIKFDQVMSCNLVFLASHPAPPAPSQLSGPFSSSQDFPPIWLTISEVTEVQPRTLGAWRST